jgi:hypothetical protein
VYSAQVDSACWRSIPEDSIDTYRVSNRAASVCSDRDVMPFVCCGSGCTSSAGRRRCLSTIPSWVVWTNGANPFARLNGLRKHCRFHLANHDGSRIGEDLDEWGCGLLHRICIRPGLTSKAILESFESYCVLDTKRNRDNVLAIFCARCK